jgi:hypothetical protein
MKVIISQKQIDKLKSLIDKVGIDSLGIEPYKLIEMGVVEHYHRSLPLNRTPIESLGSLEEVGGYLDLSHTQITSLGDLEEVDGDLYLNNTSIESFGKLKSVEGYLYLRNTPISRTMSKYDIKKKIKVRGDILFVRTHQDIQRGLNDSISL